MSSSHVALTLLEDTKSCKRKAGGREIRGSKMVYYMNFLLV